MQEIFVFGSNLAGRHGKGAALFARLNHGAIYGQSFGLQGNSFAIPTKDKNIRTLPLSDIERYVSRFLIFAANNQDMVFNLTPIGCGLAGYKTDQIMPFFKNKTENVKFNKEWFEGWVET